MRKSGFCVSGGAVIVAMTCVAADAWAQQPPAAPPPPPPTIIIVQQQAQSTPMANPGLVAGGGVLIGLGGVGMLIGIPITIWGASIVDSCQETFDPTTHTFVCNGSGGRAGTLAGGIVTDILSAGMIAGGIAMVVIGLRPPPAPAADARVETAIVPTLKLGPGSAALDVSF